MRPSVLLAASLVLIANILFATGIQAANALFPGGRGGEVSTTEEVSKTPDRSVAIWNQAAAWVWAKQREFHRALTQELRALRGQNGVGWGLVLMSFLYGIFHAAGPGHGKAALTTYLVTHHSRVNRAIFMGIAAALLQGVTALVVVYGLIGLAGWLPGETQSASLWAARASFVLLALVGLYLLVRAVKSLISGFRSWRHASRETHEHHHDHHTHGHDHSHDHHHGHHHAHEHGESCGCNHLPSASQIDAADSHRASVGVILAIGLRPCSGAVLVLILASVMGLAWHGAFAVLAMSAGTAITVITLAFLATKARSWASRMVEHRSPLWGLAGGGVGALGGALIAAMGFLLLSTSFSVQSALGI